LILPAVVCGQDDEHLHHHAMAATSEHDPPIKITINPEERVSVVLAGALPQPAPCGSVIDLPVKIVNQGFVTARLEAQLIGETPAGVYLDFHSEPLKGVPEESRQLHIMLTKPGLTDLTVSFKAHDVIPDLGGRDRVHFLISCLEAAK
jgi:hypothetical protein